MIEAKSYAQLETSSAFLEANINRRCVKSSEASAETMFTNYVILM